MRLGVWLPRKKMALATKKGVNLTTCVPICAIFGVTLHPKTTKTNQWAIVFH